MPLSNFAAIVAFARDNLATINITNIVTFVGAHKLATMLIFFAAMVFEGESFLIAAGVLVHLGALSIWEVLAVSILGVFVGDIFWYFIGTVLRKIKRAEPLVFWLAATVDRFLPDFKDKPFVSLILAKYIYGTNHATLIVSGVIGMNIWLFIKAEIVASVIWIAIFLTAGYFFGSVALLISHKVSIYLLVILIFIGIFIAAQRAVSYYYERKQKAKQAVDNL
ncbi:MAG: DedA family protein [Candidatus Paceibacterota bacterium]|jgi:membrane-associated protein